MALTIAILEFVAGGGFCETGWNKIPGSLRREGAAMLNALVEDLASTDIRPVSCLDERFVGHSITNPNDYSIIHADDDWQARWLDLARGADATLLVAPETDHILLDLSTWLRHEGVHVILSDELFLSATTDKLATARHLHQSTVLHPKTIDLNEWITGADDCEMFVDCEGGFVVKSRNGAGCDSVRRVRDIKAIDTWCKRCRAPEDWIVQPWIDGQAGSVTVLCGPKERVVLPASTQKISADPKVDYRGGAAPWLDASHRSISEFATRVLDAVPGTPLGWVGIDWVFSKEQQFVAIEINPRVTTSILGLRHLFSTSITQAMIDCGLGLNFCLEPTDVAVEWSTFPTTTVEVQQTATPIQSVSRS